MTDRSVGTTVSGNCSLHDERYSLSPVSAERLERALGPGRYTAHGDVFSDDRGDATRAIPLSGECQYVDTAGVRRLSVSLGSRDLPYSSYGDARWIQHHDPRAAPVDGTDGYVISQDVVDLDGSRTQRAVAVVFDGARVVSADLLVPAQDVNAGAQAVAVVREALDVFRAPMAPATAVTAGRG